MKFLPFIAALILANIIYIPCSKAENDQKLLSPKIKSVTVFLFSAEINTTSSTNINAGATDIIIYGLPTSLNANSINVSGSGDFTILNVSSRFNYLREGIRKPSIKKLDDSLLTTKERIETEINRKTALEQEESMILANKSIGGDNVGVSITELKQTADFFRERILSIRNLISKTNKKINELKQIEDKLNGQIGQENINQNLTTTEVQISVSAKANCFATINLSFVANPAGWTPKYDLRAASIKSPIELLYKADVYQQTGMDWDKVKITLSTLNPNDRGMKSELNPQLLSYYQKQVLLQESASAKSGEIRNLSTRSFNNAVSTSAGVFQDENVQAYQTTLARNFEIGIPYSISSGGQAITVAIQEYKIPATYSHATVPKLDPSVYLLGYINNWEEYNLLAGGANIYFEGVFVGETYINPVTTSDTLAVSLGKDKGIVATRKKIKDLDSEKTIGSNKRENFIYEIELRNTKNAMATILVEDQIPIISDNSIEVKIIDLGNAVLNKETGKIVWKISLAPSETRKLRFSYEVKYPKDKRLIGL